MENQNLNLATRNDYYRKTTGRYNHIKIFIVGAICYYAAYVRFVMEIFLRSKFGERYFTLGFAILVGAILLCIPYYDLMTGRGNDHVWTFIKSYWSWYIFIALYIKQCIKHYRDVRELRKAFNLDKSSGYSGDLHEFFWNLKIFGRPATRRQIECVLEPAIFFIAGLLLFALGQALGVLFMVGAFIYGVSYYANYWMTNEMILDLIDEKNANAAMEELVDNVDRKSESYGFVFRGNLPQNKVDRQEILEGLANKPESTEVK